MISPFCHFQSVSAGPAAAAASSGEIILRWLMTFVGVDICPTTILCSGLTNFDYCCSLRTGLFARVNFEEVVFCSLLLSIKVKRKTFSASGVAISNKRALTSLHGMVPLNTPVTITTRNGTKIQGRVEFERFERNMVDIAVIIIESSAVFNHFMPYCDQPVRLAQQIAVIGLKYLSDGDTVGPYARLSSVDSIEELGESSALFHAQYYNFQGCSGTGVITTVVDDKLVVVGVHVASHDDSRWEGTKGKKKRPYSDLEASVASAIHGHTAYSLVCEIARVPDLLELLSA